MLLALLLDKRFGEPQHWHPLVIFGAWADVVEHHLNRGRYRRLKGIVGVMMAVVPLVAVAFIVDKASGMNVWLHLGVSAVVLYVAIGWQSLLGHAQQIILPLASGDLAGARKALSMIVSRDTATLEEKDIAKAATESVLENGADAIFSALFWFCVWGIPGVVCYRLSNTLDAMWGYRNERFIQFGWCAARLDDVLNFIPARLTALSYALVGRFTLSLRCWRRQAWRWKSPNAGPVMAAGAGALNVSLGGVAVYHGEEQSRPVLGPLETEHSVAGCASIVQACALVNRSLVLWVSAITVLGLL